MTAADTPEVDNVPWLSECEQLVWRNMVESWRMISAQLDKDLRAAFNIGISEYEVLVRLSETEDWSWRMSELAYDVDMSRSRLTHIVSRMEQRKLVYREAAENDGRGVRCVMTETGWELLKTAAPVHVRGVRKNLIDVLTQVELEQLAVTYVKVNAHVRGLR